MTETVVKPSPPLSYTQKLSLIAGSATVLYFLPSEAQAADIRYINNAPVTITFAQAGQTVGWDIDGAADGNTNPDFNLVARAISGLGQRSFIQLTSNGLSGQGFVRDLNDGTDEDILWLQQNVIVSNSLGANGPIDYVWGGLGVVNRTVLSLQNGSFLTPDVIIPAGQGFPPGDPTTATGLIGFRFLGANNEIQYGWGEMQLVVDQGNPGNSRVTITRWAYNAEGCIGGIPLNSPCANNGVNGTAIEVGNIGGGGGNPQVPEPTSPLALLALGAAGVYRWRKERQESE